MVTDANRTKTRRQRVSLAVAALLPWDKNTTLFVRRSEKSQVRLKSVYQPKILGTINDTEHDWTRFRLCCDIQNTLNLAAELFVLMNDSVRLDQSTEFTNCLSERQKLNKTQIQRIRLSKRLDTFANKHIDPYLIKLVASAGMNEMTLNARKQIQQFLHRRLQDAQLTKLHKHTIEKLKQRTHNDTTGNKETFAKIAPGEIVYKSTLLGLVSLAFRTITTLCNETKTESTATSKKLCTGVDQNNSLSGIRMLSGETKSTNVSGNVSIMFFRTGYKSLLGLPYDQQRKRFLNNIPWSKTGANCSVSSQTTNHIEKLRPQLVQKHIETYRRVPSGRKPINDNTEESNYIRPESKMNNDVRVETKYARLEPIWNDTSSIKLNLLRTPLKIIALRLNLLQTPCVPDITYLGTDCIHVTAQESQPIGTRDNRANETEIVLFDPMARVYNPSSIDNLLREIYNLTLDTHLFALGNKKGKRNKEHNTENALQFSFQENTNQAGTCQANDRGVKTTNSLRRKQKLRTSCFLDNLLTTLNIIAKLLTLETHYINHANIEFYEHLRNTCVSTIERPFERSPHCLNNRPPNNPN